MATMLGLMLCCAGCGHNTRLASVRQGPLGNAILAILPPGSVVEVASADDAAQLQMAFVNEMRPSAASPPERDPTPTSRRLLLTAPLRLCTPAYLAERDLAELEQWRVIEALKIEIQQGRNK